MLPFSTGVTYQVFRRTALHLKNSDVPHSLELRLSVEARRLVRILAAATVQGRVAWEVKQHSQSWCLYTFTGGHYIFFS